MIVGQAQGAPKKCVLGGDLYERRKQLIRSRGDGIGEFGKLILYGPFIQLPHQKAEASGTREVWDQHGDRCATRQSAIQGLGGKCGEDEK